MQSGAGSDFAVLEFDPTADFFIARHDLRDEIMLLQPRLELRMPPRRAFEELRCAEQDDRQLQRRERHAFLLRASAGACMHRCARFCPTPNTAHPIRANFAIISGAWTVNPIPSTKTVNPRLC